MPELPEVETMVRGIRSHVEGRTVTDVVRPPCSRKPISLSPRFSTLRKRSLGQVVQRVWRRAKRIILELETGDSFLIEPRMTGLMLIADPPSVEHLRMEWQFGPQHSLWFWDRRGLGTIQLVSPAEREEILNRLGPDALDISLSDWIERISRTQRPVKIALLDQKLVAGIGNLYASEILHRARIHPECPAADLSRKQLTLAHQFTYEVLNEAIRYEGSTLSDGTYRNALNKDGGYQNAHRVYDREGETCPTCRKAVIQRIVQGQRSTFFCHRCQKRSD